MTGADFIIAINFSIAGLLAVGFGALATFGTRKVPARWLAASCGLALASFLLEFLIPRSGGALLVGLGAYGTLLAALMAFNAGLSRLYGRKIPWLLLVSILAGGCATRLAIEGLPRDLLFRQIAFQLPYAVMQGAGILILWPVIRRRLDGVFAAVLAMGALHFLTKPLAAALTDGVGGSAAAYSATFYAMVSQSSGTVIGLAILLVFFAVLIRDMLQDYAARAETDALSGLLNKGGFEEKRDRILRQTAAKNLPVSLVLCDLDEFKSVNDTYGHAAGDRAIVSAARLLRAHADGRYPVGRIGGEEFAVLLPGLNLSAARLYAETLRLAFATETLPELGKPLTASFGVAEAGRDEDGANLQARADAALYGAKGMGRDRVHVAGPVPVAQPEGQRVNRRA